MAKAEVEANADVPLFLQKAFHLINTADPKIASWSEDGESFVVKDPELFQTVCIPAYFKHSKFTSFVRQLNFYAFKKLSTASLRIDEKADAETANHWRFRHENFRKGRPDLLSKIKRLTGGTRANASKQATVPSPEVQSLKERIEEMSKNIDELTAMVQEVSLKQEEQEKAPAGPDAQDAAVGSKRKKMDSTDTGYGAVAADAAAVRPDSMVSSMDVDHQKDEDLPLPPPLPPVFPMPMSPVSQRETSDSTQMSDNDFVNQLFAEFSEAENALLQKDDALAEPEVSKLRPAETLANRPDPELMERLSEALALLPKDIQVLIVDRLIAAITSTDGFENSPEHTVATSIEEELVDEDMEPKKVAAAAADSVPSAQAEGENKKTFPLAAATLAALLHHYSAQVKSTSTASKGKSNPKSVQKTIPVIPIPVHG